MAEARVHNPIEIDPETCVKCNLCDWICPGDVIYKEEDNRDALPEIVYPDECWYCGLCQRICPTSAQAFEEYRRFLRDGAAVPTGWLDVRGQRELSQLVEARTGVRHESPQALLLKDGKAVWNASHHAITSQSLRSAVGAESAGKRP